MILEDFLQRFGASLSRASGAAVLVSIVAGVLASAVCPCTLPVGIGLATAAGGTESQERRSGLLIALAFFFGINFLALLHHCRQVFFQKTFMFAFFKNAFAHLGVIIARELFFPTSHAQDIERLVAGHNRGFARFAVFFL